MYSKKVRALKAHCVINTMLTLNSDIIRLLLHEPSEVTFATSEYQYSDIAAILGFSYLKVIYYYHSFLTAVSKERRVKDLSVFCDLTAGILKILL